MPVKPTEQEDEYFLRIEQEMKKQLQERTSEFNKVLAQGGLDGVTCRIV